MKKAFLQTTSAMIAIVFVYAICAIVPPPDAEAEWQHTYFNAKYRYHCHDNGVVCLVEFLGVTHSSWFHDDHSGQKITHGYTIFYVYDC